MKNYLTQVWQLLKNSQSEAPHKTALICGKSALTYEQIFQASQGLAKLLADCGVRRSDRVVIFSGNTVDSVLAYWAAQFLGAVACVIHPETLPEKFRYILEDSEAKVFIQSDAIWDSNSRKILNLFNLDLLLNNFINFKNTKSCPVLDPVLDIDLSMIMYTSGSTGEPKGVMLTQRNVLAACYGINTYLGHSNKDIIASVLPISFDYGLYQMIMAFSVGATLILEKDFVLPFKFLQKIEKYQATIVPLVPSMVPILKTNLLKHPFFMNSVRAVTNTGAALTGKNIKEILEIFSAAQLFSMYGLTECKRCTYLPPEDLFRKAGSVGKAIPGTEMWIADALGKRLPPNTVGQLVIRGATVMKGYWKKPEKTEERLKNGLLPQEKLLYTGDQCFIDEEGYLFFQGRMDEILKIRGMKVSPREIEEVLSNCPGVKEAVAIGIDDEDQGQLLYLFISLESSIDSSGDSSGEFSADFHEKIIKKYVQENLASHSQPHEIMIIDELPKTGNGKIDRLKLKELKGLSKSKAHAIEV